MSGVAGDGPVGCKLLDGVTVVEVAHELTEYAGTILAGLGAEVWLVEPPAGCRTRQRRPFAEQASASRQSIPFLARNAGKRSVVIDPADPSAAAAFAALLARADVVIEHQESGIGAWTAAADVPVVRITDPDGIGASSVVVFAASGSLSSSGWPHQPPCNAPSWLALDAVGTFAAAMAVLLVREHRVSGRRRRCDVPVQEAGIAGLTNWTRNMHSYGTASAGQGAETKRLGSGPFPVFPCADGYVRIIAATPRQWEAMLELLDRPELLLQPEWASFQFRNENFDVIFLVAAEILATRRADDVFHRGQSLGLPVAPVLGLPSVIGDPHVRAREMFTTVQDPEVGPVQMLRAAVRTGEARDVRALLPAPALGEHQHDLPRPGGGRRPPTAARTGHTPVGLPLAGVRVLSFGVGAVIPEATSFLALMGAEVIKVESSNGLDFFRQVGGDATGDINNSATFNQANLGVQSCAVNAASEEGRAVLRTLVATCDIVMENMRGPVMRKFGMDYESVRAVRPDIIYISSQGFGTGPYETFQTYGPSLQSFAGMTSIWAHPDDPYPVGSTLSYPDMLAGKQGLAAVLAALVRRDATGRGCALDCAQFEVCLWSIADKFLQEQLLPGTVRALGNRSLDAAPHGCFPCAGADQWCALSVDDDEAWRRFVELIDDQRLGGARFATAAARVSMADEIDPIVGEWTSRSTPADVVELLRGRGIAASIIVDGASQAADRAMHDSGFYVAIAHPAAGVRWHTGLPFVLDGGRVPVRRAPIIGEHTEHVLLDVLGVSPSDLSHLVASGAVGT